MIPDDDYECWVRKYKLTDKQTIEVLYPLVSNLWTLARQLEKKEKPMGEELKLEELSITATGK